MKFSRPTLLLLLAFAVYWSFESQTPREQGLLALPVEDFDLDKASAHVASLSNVPHAVGFEAHDRVRDYLAAELRQLGLSVELQTGYTSGDWANVSRATNILARIKGSRQGGKDLLLLSHYDSSPHSSFGASDAASGVATILEGVRAFLAKGITPENDIVILFTDAEELGLNGADLFANTHPWADNIGLILNFEARGSGGPSIMLVETNRGNERLIRAFQAAGVRFPVANSLAYSIYKMLPNDTDLTVFREDRDIDGFNFAFIDDHFDYHTALDRANRLDARTLAHQGSYLAPLLAYFSQADLSDLKSPNDRVYYNMPYYGLISYPFDWIWPMYLIAVVLFIGLVAYGLRRKKFNGKQLIKALFPLFGSLAINAVIGLFGWGVLVSLYPSYEDMLHGFPYNGHAYIYAFAAFSLASCFFMYNRFYALKGPNLLLPPLVLWLVLTGLLNAYLPGAAYFIVPVYALLGGFLISMDEEKPNLGFRFLLALPAVFVLVPSAYLFPVALGLKLLASTTLLLTLTFVVTLPFWNALRMMTRLGVLSLVVGFLFLGKAHFRSDFTEDRPKPTSLLYLKDLNRGESFWASYDKKLHPWNSGYFADALRTDDTLVASAFSSKYGTRLRRLAHAPEKDMPEPELIRVQDTVIDSLRYLTLRIQSNRPINRLDVNASGKTIMGAVVNGAKLDQYFLEQRKSMDGPSRLFTHYVSAQADTELQLVVPASGEGTLDLEIFEASNDLLKHPQFSISRRPEDVIPMPFVLNDAVVLKKLVHIE